MKALLEPQTIILIITAAILIGHWIAFRRTLLHEALLSMRQDYRSEKMLIAIERLWDLWRDNNKIPANVVNDYMRQYYANKDKARSQEGRDLKDFVEMTLHNHRRIVSQFYSYLAIIYTKGILTEPEIFEFWSEKDLQIIPNVIIPIENRLRKEIHDPPSDPLGDKDSLWTLYNQSKDYKLWKAQLPQCKLKAAVLKKRRAVTNNFKRRWS
jgi:hypothetical protein